MIVVQTSEFVVKYHHHFLLHLILILLLLLIIIIIIIVTIASVPSASTCGPEQSERVYTQAHTATASLQATKKYIPLRSFAHLRTSWPDHCTPTHSATALRDFSLIQYHQLIEIQDCLQAWEFGQIITHTSDISHGNQNMSIERDLLFQTKLSLRSNSKLQGQMLVSLKIEKTKGLLCLMFQSFHQTTNKWKGWLIDPHLFIAAHVYLHCTSFYFL